MAHNFLSYSRPRFKDARSKETPRLKDDFFPRTEGADRQYNIGVYTISTPRTPHFHPAAGAVFGFTTRAKI